jgi:hypothetical protein
MVLAIEQCHKHGFIHRDIKPDVSTVVSPPFLIVLNRVAELSVRPRRPY